MSRFTILFLIAGAMASGLAISPARAQQEDASEHKVSVQLRDVGLRAALALVFQGSGQQYAVEANTPNLPITLSVRDLSLPVAARLIARLAGATVRREGDVWVFGLRRPAPPPVRVETVEAPPSAAPRSEIQLVKIPLNYNSVYVIAAMLGARVLPTEADLYARSRGSGFSSIYGASALRSNGFYGGSQRYGGYGGSQRYGGYGGSRGYGGGGYNQYGSGYGGYTGFGNSQGFERRRRGRGF